MRARLGVAAGIVALVGALLASALPAAAVTRPPVDRRIRAQSLALERCDGVPGARCGTVTVPLDRAHPGGRTIGVSFELYVHRDQSQPAVGTVVAVEGGPGYPTRGSRDSYLDLFDPLLDRRDLLLVDNRGTGTSGVINCERLQSYEGRFADTAGECARQLGDSADDYGTGNAVEDMVAVFDALGLRKVDLYGDSYGTFFGQTFAVRHPERVRSLILDGAYPIEGFDPWFRDSNRALRNAFRVACRRAPGCAARGGDPINRMRTLTERVRTAPITGSHADADGVMRTVTIDPPALAYLAWSASGSATLYRELDPAIRAVLRPTNPDPVPLVRLAAENLPFGGAGDVADFSEGLYAAVICHDYPQLWDPKNPHSIRESQYRASIANLRRDDPNAFAPFRIDDWINQPLEEWDYCLRWPAASVPDPPRPPAARYPRIPTLVLASDLDSNTSPEGGREVARRFGATFVENVNYTHVSALGDFGRCASRIVLRFVRALEPGDTSCSRKYNENRIVDIFPRRAAGLPGASADEKIARAATGTAADVVARWWSMVDTKGVGLRGGTFTAVGDVRVRFRLRAVKWVEDVVVNGVVTWQRDTGALQAKLVTRQPDGSRSHLTIGWNDWTPVGRAHIAGTVDRRPVDLDIPAA